MGEVVLLMDHRYHRGGWMRLRCAECWNGWLDNPQDTDYLSSRTDLNRGMAWCPTCRHQAHVLLEGSIGPSGFAKKRNKDYSSAFANTSSSQSMLEEAFKYGAKKIADAVDEALLKEYRKALKPNNKDDEDNPFI